METIAVILPNRQAWESAMHFRTKAEALNKPKSIRSSSARFDEYASSISPTTRSHEVPPS